MPRLSGPQYPATVAIGRPALHDVLIKAATELGAEIRLGTTITSLKPSESAVTVELSDGRTASYDFVVGCDGIRSTVRKLAFDSVPEATFTGLAVWRATMPRHGAVDGMQMFYGPKVKCGVNPHSPEEMFLFLVQPIRDDRRLPPDQMHVLLRDQLDDFSADVVAFAREHITDPGKVDYRPMNSFLLPSPWYRGRVVVIAAAAHTTTPHLATGPATPPAPPSAHAHTP